MTSEDKIPCDGCICLPVCVGKKRLGNRTLIYLYEDCGILKQYLHGSYVGDFDHFRYSRVLDFYIDIEKRGL